MKLGILSDTHGYLHPAFKDLFKDVDYILHAGDIGTPDVLRQLEAIAPTVAVRGNIDGEVFYETPKLEHRRLGDIRVTIVHNAGDIIRPAYDLRSRILKSPTDLLISGHYHGYWCTEIATDSGPVLWLSPGAAGNSGHHRERTALLLTIPEREARAGTLVQDAKLEKINLGPREYATDMSSSWG